MERMIRLWLFIIMLATTGGLAAQCTNTSSYGSGTAPGPGASATGSGATYAGDYNTWSGFVSGAEYTVTTGQARFLTIRSGTYNGTVQASGMEPVTFTATAAGTFYIHVNTNASCGTNSTSHIVTVTRPAGPSSGCTTASGGQWPSTTFTPTCSGSSQNITTSGYATEYSVVAVVSGNTYSFTSSVSTDYLTIATNVSTPVVITHGTTPVTWVASSSTTIRLYNHANSNCDTQSSTRTRAVTCSGAAAGCTNTSSASTGAGPAAGATVTGNCTAAQYRGYTSGIVTATEYTASSSTASDYITVRTSTSSGTVLAHGPSPLVFTTTSTASLYVHLNTNSACGTNATGRTLSLSRASLGCTSAINGSVTGAAIVCSGTAQSVSTSAGSYYVNVTLMAGMDYSFTSSVTTDYVTIANSSGTIQTHGPSGLVFTPATTGTYRYYVHADAGCTTVAARTRYITCVSSCSNGTSAGTSTTGPAAGAFASGACTATQYRTFTGIANATQYTVSSSLAGDFITVRTGASGPGTTVVAEGIAPLSFTTSATTSLFVHVNTNEACGTNSTSRTLTLSRAGNGAPCGNTSSAGSITAPTLGNTSNTTFQANQYRTMTPASGAQYRITSAVETDYITVRLSNSTSGTVLAHGPSPMVVITNATATLYISVNLDNTCATNAISRAVAVTREAVDPCALPTTALICGTASDNFTMSGTGAWSTNVSCNGTTNVTGQEKIFSFTSGLAGTYTLAQASSSYVTAYYYFRTLASGCEPSGWTCIGSAYNNENRTFTATASTQYQILMDVGTTSSITANVTVHCPPTNDQVCDAITIICGQSLNGSTMGATNNAGASNYEGSTSCGSVSQATARAAVWYKVVGNGQSMTASLCATSPTWDSRINVYSGASCSSLTCVGGNDDSGPDCSGNQASYKWNSVSGTTYYIRVHGYGSEAIFNLALNCQDDPCAPANILPLTCGTATSATMSGSGIHDPYSCSSTPGQERFYSFTPLGSGSYSITQNSNSAGVMRYHYKTVSSGCSASSWTCIGSVTSTGTTSTFNLTGGTAYYIIVDQGATTSGTVNFTLNCPPDNDLVCNAADISCGQTVNGSTLMGGNAGSYEYSGSSCGGISHSYSSAGVWYKVTGNGQALTASLCGTSPVWNSRINIYSGATCTGTLTCLGGNDDNGPVCTSSTQASYSWPSVNGTVYWIKVHGYSTDANFSLSLTCVPLAQGSTCADPIIASSFPYTNANTTCDKWNTYGNQCSSSYGSGANDAVYQLNISQTGTYSFELNSSSPYIGWFLKNSANCATASSCLANGQSGSGTTASGSYNFTSTGTYYLVVTHYYTYSSYVECAEYTLNILPPITNDNCAGGIALTVNPTIACGTSTSGTTIGATQSQTACSGNGTASHDVWYTFQATATSHVVTVTRGSLQYPAVQVFSGACSGNGAVAGNSIACESTTSSSVNEVSAVLSGLSIGNTYRVRVHSFYSGASYAGGFSICVATPSPCTVGTASPAGIQTPSCTGSASSVSGSVGTGYTRVNLTGGTPYTFSSSRTADYLTITNSTGGIAYVYGPGPITWTPPGTGTDEYRFYTHSDINCGTIGTRTRYVSCPPPPPANDDCAGAVNIVPSLTCETITGTLGGATQSIPAASTCGVNTGASANDVWYKFTATANNHVVNVRATSNTDLIMAVYHGGATGICNGTYVSCMDQMYFTTTDTESLPVATVPGDVYFVRVYAYNGAASTSNTFQICVTVPAPNNSCSSMEMLTVSSDVPNNSCDNNTRVGNTAGASQDGPQPTCGGSVGPWADVWYSFNSGYNSAILTTLVPSSAVMGSLVLDLYTGSCGALTPVACYLGSEAGNPVLPVQPNTEYVLRVSTNRRNQIGGTFSICLSSPPKPSCITEAPVPAAASVLCASGSDVILDWPEADHPSTYALLFNSAPLGGAAPALATSPLPGSYLVLPSDPQVATSYNVGILPPGQYVWRVVPRNGNGSPNPACTAPATTWRFTVQPVPTVTSTGSYGPVCANGALIPLAGVGAPSGGTGAWSGPGVSNSAPWTFNPAIAGAGTHSLSFTYTANGCTSAASTVSVIVNGLPVVNAGSYGPLCIENSDVTLLGSPAGGTWSGTGVTGDQFSPSAGTQTLTYTYADGNGCSNSDQVVITVNPAPVVDAGSYGPFCSTDANVDLVGSPTGGTWSGTGVTGNQFSPSAGTQTLTYTYADGNSCTSSATVTVTVNTATIWYLDQDSDGFGDPNSSMLACEQPAGYVANNSDCDDSDEQAYAGASCTTGDPCIIGETLDANCNCTGGTSLPDSDNDGICDIVDTCPLAVDGIANFDANTCACEPGYFATFTDINGNDVITACGICPPGYFCADGIASVPCPINTYNPSQGQTECLPCASGESSGTGAVACTPDGIPSVLNLEFRTPDGSSNEVSWEIVNASDAVVCAGGLYSPGITSPLVESCSLLDGCYRLRVFDSAGDGFGANGGYQLRLSGADPTNLRIIDNLGNFNSGSLSAISGGSNAFCFPMSTQKPLYHHRDRLDFVSNEYLVCEEDLAVSAQWQVGDQTLSGYQFWFFDPNGGFSYRRGRNHATSDNFGNVGATRACHMRINNWAVANQIPENVLMNVRIRTRVNGVYGDFGPAYRFKIDPVRAQCKLTKLLDYVESEYLSCNSIRNFGASNWVHARAVPGANKYQFRFRIPAEGFVIARTSNTYFLQLNWTTDPLLAGKTYVVDVRASKDGGATWCAANGPEWGDLCNLTISANAQGEEQNITISGNDIAGLRMWPNPNAGDQLWIDLSGIEAGVEAVAVDIFDLTGKQLVSRMIPTQGTHLNTTIALDSELATGLYLVNITAGTKRYTERLVIAK